MYKGHDATEDRTVAVKLFNSNTRTNTAEPRMFTCTHGHIVSVFGIGNVMLAGERRLCAVMELLHGESLLMCLRQSRATPLSWKVRVIAIQDTCRALRHIHGHLKLAHGNVTSHNILFADAGMTRVKLGDFGSSHFGQGCQEVNDARIVYVDPSAGRGAHDWQADVYAVGVVLLEVLTGMGANMEDVVAATDEYSDTPERRQLSGTPRISWHTAASRERRGNLVEHAAGPLECFRVTDNDAGLVRLVDTRLDLHPVSETIPVFALAAECISEDRDARPTAAVLQEKLGGIVRRYDNILKDEHMLGLARKMDACGLASTQRELLALLQDNEAGQIEQILRRHIAAAPRRPPGHATHKFVAVSDRPCGLLLQYCFAYLELPPDARSPARKSAYVWLDSIGKDGSSTAAYDSRLPLWAVLRDCAELYFAEQVRRVPDEAAAIKECISYLARDSGHEGMYQETIGTVRDDTRFHKFLHAFDTLEASASRTPGAGSAARQMDGLDAFAVYQHGRSVKDRFDNFMHDLAKGSSTKYQPAPLKRVYRMVEKSGLRTKNVWDSGTLTDVVRGTLGT